MKITEVLNKKKEQAKLALRDKGYFAEKKVLIGRATCEIAAGSPEVEEVFKQAIDDKKIDAYLGIKGCVGKCYLEPTVKIIDGDKSFLYVQVTKEKAQEILEKHLIGGNEIKEYIDPGSDAKQMRVALQNCGAVDPESLDDYLVNDGYLALAKVFSDMKPETVIEEVEKSGLRGRGGAGFPTGLKWSLTAKVESEEKYIVCNADEGDPGAFMDRSMIEGDPHCLLEGMLIAAYATGATHGAIYIRAEYPLAIQRLEKAICDAKENNLLGDNILGTDFCFDIELRLGAGAFVCGEETALLMSIEGYRGMPNPRPPYPSVKGLFDKPTVVNNVETWCNIPKIILKGSKWFSSIGTEKSKGTKVFALAGAIKNTGLVEVPMGITLREVIYEIGGGIIDDKDYKGVQTGGPSGGCLIEENLDTQIDYESLAKAGSIMGSGGMIVMDNTTCMVNISKFFLEFTQDESCGKCTPCREGTKRMLEILTNITEGKGQKQDLEKLEKLAILIKDTSLCGLGQSAPNPVLSTLKNFRNEYEEHILEQKCSSGSCLCLVEYKITDKCIGCTVCSKVCPVDAISGVIKKQHVIAQDICVKCGECFNVCKFDAIDR